MSAAIEQYEVSREGTHGPNSILIPEAPMSVGSLWRADAKWAQKYLNQEAGFFPWFHNISSKRDALWEIPSWDFQEEAGSYSKFYM